MAALDPLSIAVRLVEDEQNNVKSLVSQINKELSSTNFKISVGAETTKSAKDLLENLGKMVGVLENIKKGMSGATWGSLPESTETLITKFTALKQNALEISAAMANAFPAGLMKEIAALEKAANMLKEVRSASRGGDGSGGIATAAKSINAATYESEKAYRMIQEIQAMSNRLESHGVNTSAFSGWISQINKIRDGLEQIKRSTDGMNPDTGLGTKAHMNFIGAKEQYALIKQGLEPYKELENELKRLLDMQSKLTEGLGKLGDENPFKAQVQNAIRDLEMLRQYMANQPLWDLGKNIESNNSQIKAYTDLLANANQAQKGIEENAKNAAAEEKRFAQNSKEAETAIDAIDRKLKEISKLISKQEKLGLDTSNLERAKAELENLRSLYQQVQSGSIPLADVKGAASTTIANREVSEAIAQAKKEIADEERALKQNEKAAARAAKEAQKLSSEEQKLAQAMQRANQQASMQSYMLSDLKSMAQQYIGIWALSNFVQSMAQITGELELQQKSLEVIIGSASYASQLFGEIRDLSQQSPYTFQDLLKSTRQLAAFGIQTKDLYGTMKALSDIGAGLSVDVQRLILAYGHVKSYGYLSGIQNRQFETAGIDLVGALTDRYNKLADAEERAGRAATHVTRKDVFKKISKKEVGFEDVNAVIMELDQPGGKFYNMQERQFETLGGKLRNLRNNYNIMMAEMGKETHGMLMGGVETLNELTGNWAKYAKLLGSILIPLGAVKLAMIALNAAIGLQRDSMATSIVQLSRMQNKMNAIANAPKGGLMAAFMGGWNAQSFSPTNADAKSFQKALKKQFSSGAINRAQLLNLGISRELPNTYRRAALELAGFNAQQQKAILSAGFFNRMLLKMKINLASFGASLRLVGQGIAALFRGIGSMLLNPMTIMMAAISGIMYMIERTRSLNQSVEEAREKYGAQANEDVKNIDDTMSKYKDLYSENGGSQISYGGASAKRSNIEINTDALAGQNIENIIDDLKQKLQAYAPLYDADIFDIEKAETEAERLEKTFDKLESHKYAKQIYAMIPDQIAQANRETGGIWNDTFAEQAKDYQDAVREYMRTISKISETEYQSILPEQRKQIENYQKELGITRDDAIRKYLQDPNVTLKKTISEQTNGKATQRVVDVGGVTLDRNTVSRKWRAVISDSENMVNEYTQIFKKFFQNDPLAAEDFFITSLGDLLSESKVTDPEVTKSISEYLMTQVQAGIAGMSDVSDEFKKKINDIFFMNNVKSEYQKNMENSGLNYQSSREDVEKTSQDAWKKAFSTLAMSSESAEAKTAYGKLAIEHMEGYKEGIEQFWRKWHPNEEWKQRFLYDNVNGKQQMSDFAKYFQQDVLDSGNYYDFWFETMKKKHDEFSKKLTNMFVPLRKKWGIQIDTDIKFKTTDIEKLEKLKASIESQILVLDNDKKAQEELQTVLDVLNPQLTMLRLMKKEGIEFEDKNKNTGGKGHYKDTEYEAWEQRIKIIQEARREYEYWEKSIGKESAQDRVKKQFESLIGNDKVLKPGDLDNLEKYGEVLKRINEEVEKRYKKDKVTKGQNAQIRLANDVKLLREIAKTMYDISKMEFGKNTEDFVSRMNKNLDDLSQRWEMFNSIRSKTGNIELAQRMAGFTGTDMAPGVVFRADAIKKTIQETMRKSVPLAGNLDFDKILGLSDKDMENYVQDLFRGYTDELYAVIADTKSTDTAINDAKDKLAGYEERIKAVVGALKEWQKAEKELQKTSAERVAEVLGQSQFFGDIARRIQDELTRALDEINNDSNSTPAEKLRAQQIEEANANMKMVSSMPEYERFFNDALTESAYEMERLASIIKDALNKQLKAGSISATEYSKKVKEVNDQLKVFKNDNYNSWWNKQYTSTSWQDQFQRDRKNGEELTSRGDQIIQEAYAMSAYAKTLEDPKAAEELLKMAEAMEKAGKKMKKDGEEMVESANQSELAMKKLSAVSQALNSFFSGIADFAETGKNLTEAFELIDGDDYGKTRDLLDVFGAAGSGLSQTTQSLMSGDFVGAMMGIVNTFVGVVKAIAQMRDNEILKHIKQIERSTKHIENATEFTKKLAEKDLGYSKNSTLRSLYQSYAGQEIKDSHGHRANSRYTTSEGYYGDYISRNRASLLRGKGIQVYGTGGENDASMHAMAEFYDRQAGAASAYQAEYDALIDERRLKMEQYNEENRRKNKNKDVDKLEDLTNEIAELDFQIMTFAEDLMNTLWGIDFQGWASQISDALMTAFENGTNAADAFKDTMQDIMRSVVKNMVNLAIIEPFVNRLKERLVGENGIINSNTTEDFMRDPSAFTGAIVGEIGKWYREDGIAMITAGQEVYDGMNDLLKGYGLSLDSRDDSSNKSGSNSITQTITEETAGYMTGILAAIHQDGSVRRLMLGTLVSEQMPNVIEMMTVNSSHIVGIDENTRAIMHMMQDGSGQLYERVNYIGEKLDRFARGFDKVTIA